MRVLYGGLISGLLLACTGCTLSAVSGNGRRESEQREVGEFTGLQCRSSLDVKVKQGEAFAVTVNADSNLLGLIETRVIGGVLRIDTDGQIFGILPGPHVLITMPELTSAE